GWAVRVEGGHLVSIGSGAVRWWTSPNPPPMPDQWRAAARTQRHALVMIVTPGLYDDADQIDTADANTALRHAAGTGRPVGGLPPVRGTLSGPPRPAWPPGRARPATAARVRAVDTAGGRLVDVWSGWSALAQHMPAEAVDPGRRGPPGASCP